MSKLGFTFYQQDWWSSDTFFELSPSQRYIYLECLFLMYANDGYLKNNKVLLERRLGMQIEDTDWSEVTKRFILEIDMLTHISVNKRLKKAITNRENGKSGGRPKKAVITEIEKPKKPNYETQEITQKKPPYIKEIESNINKIENNIKRDDVFEDEILSLFGFSVAKNFNHARTLSAFVFVITEQGRLDYFKRQFSAYKTLKTRDGYLHSFGNFLGDQSERFQNGKWDSENWSEKLKPIAQVYTVPKRKVIDHSKL